MEKEKEIKVRSIIVRSSKAVINEVNPIRYAKFIAKQSNTNLIKNMFNLSRKPIEKQTFQEAVYKYGISEETLSRNQSFFHKAKLCFSLISVALFIYSFLLILQGNLMMPIALTVNGLVFVLLALTYGLRSHQIKIRELCSFKQYLKSIFKH
ncbi:hypothetical protein H311_03149 [Anncaliia algerae PRA109]|nr:hypothetical protein H311_03149 [Anncaliia algerae PRA109]